MYVCMEGGVMGSRKSDHMCVCGGVMMGREV